jgi:hypothetical protein
VATPSEDEISRAVVVWTGYGTTSWPQRDDDRLVAAVGSDAALDLLPIVRRLEDEFYESDARHTARDLAEMGNLAAAQFRDRHSELSDAAVAAFAWCYTYDYK